MTNELDWMYRGYTCYIRMIRDRHRCGYAKVPKGHLTKEIDSYDDVPIDVHGGLTWGNNGEWGFDCAHYDDTLDKWTLDAVKKETEHMVDELIKLTWKKVIQAKLESTPIWLKKRVTIKKGVSK